MVSVLRKAMMNWPMNVTVKTMIGVRLDAVMIILAWPISSGENLVTKIPIVSLDAVIIPARTKEPMANAATKTRTASLVTVTFYAGKVCLWSLFPCLVYTAASSLVCPYFIHLAFHDYTRHFKYASRLLQY